MDIFNRNKCKTKKMKFNAGFRLGVVIQYLKMNQVEFSEFVNVGQPTISRWLGLTNFSNLIISKLHPLESKGINLDYFRHEEQPMLTKDKILTLKEQQEKIKTLERELADIKIKLEECEKNNKG